MRSPEPLMIRRVIGGLTKWSDAKIGQSTFGGWSPEALTKICEHYKGRMTEARTTEKD